MQKNIALLTTSPLFLRDAAAGAFNMVSMLKGNPWDLLPPTTVVFNRLRLPILATPIPTSSSMRT